MQRTDKFIHNFAVILLVLLCLFAYLCCGGGAAVVRAASSDTEYSYVLDDLCQDKNFNVEDYSEDPKDYSLRVIQVAESSNAELFVYVYQPSACTLPLTATSICISTEKDGLKPVVYQLALLNYWSVFAKYLVKGFEVLRDSERIYNISEIWRPWNGTIDDPTGNDNIINEVSCAVAQEWTAHSLKDGTVSYSCITTDVVLITDKYVGRIRYFNGFKLYVDKCDSWFVTFSTDRDIECLYEADVYYLSCSYDLVSGSGIYNQKFGDPEEKYAYLTYTQRGENPANGWFGYKYTWNRIESVAEFLENEKASLADDFVETVKNMQWILRFVETSFSEGSNGTVMYQSSTIVSSVTILRLKFREAGKVYNLGVVDNKQTGTKVVGEGNKLDPYWFLRQWWFWVLVGVGLLILLFILSIVFPPIRVVFKVIWKIISAPFRGIVALVRKIRGG